MTSPTDQDDRPAGRAGRIFSRVRNTGMRDLWWSFLDSLDRRPWLRRTLVAAALASLVGTAATVWVYPWWRQRTAVDMARQWMEAGKLAQASESIQDALRIAPDDPETWKLAADLARRLGNKESAAGYSAQAAKLSPDDADLKLAWAADSLNAGHADEARQALDAVPSELRASSAHAQRMEGELARLRRDFAGASRRFEAAVKLDGPGTAINEVPLGIVLLNAPAADRRAEGLSLLEKWSSDHDWGATPSRVLLQDALVRDDRPAMLRWAENLRAHPRCTLGDIPNCLLALSRVDPVRFADVLRTMQADHSRDAANVALLASWLNQIGRARDAVEWTRSLPSALTARPPAAIAIAESLRQTDEWPALAEKTEGADWGNDLEAVRLAYALLAARKLGRETAAAQYWKTLQSRSATDGGRMLFVADSLYSWGLANQAVELMWSAADQPDVAFKTLGTLARHYQVSGDAAGQFKVFKRLHSLRPEDVSIGNNYAFFAALNGEDLRAAEQIAERNLRSAPDSVACRATYALLLCRQNRAQDALEALKPVSPGWREQPAVMLAYGLSLAGAQRKTEAREVLSAIPPADQTKTEAALIAKALE